MRHLKQGLSKIKFKHIAWLSYRYGERIKNKGHLQSVYHPESVFTRSKMNVTQPPKSLLYQEIKQGAEYFSPVQQERQLLNVDVKHYYVQIAQKNVCKSALRLSVSAIH